MQFEYLLCVLRLVCKKQARDVCFPARGAVILSYSYNLFGKRRREFLFDLQRDNLRQNGRSERYNYMHVQEANLLS